MATDYQQAQVRASLRRRRATYQQRIRTLKAEAGCADCGTHTGRLDYHHLDPATKDFNIANGSSYCQERVDAELAKCVVLCQLCHQARHVNT